MKDNAYIAPHKIKAFQPRLLCPFIFSFSSFFIAFNPSSKLKIANSNVPEPAKNKMFEKVFKLSPHSYYTQKY